MAYKTPGKTSEYIRGLMPSESDNTLNAILRDAQRLNIPVLLPESAAFLCQLVSLAKPRNVLEIGTAIGYSGCLFLKNSDCKLTTVDKNAEYLMLARNHFVSAGVDSRVQIIQEDADIVVPNLSGCFDFIFLDGPKTKYIQYLPHLFRVLATGGILFADNVFFNGMVAGEAEVAPKKKNIVEKLDLFLRALYENPCLKTSLLNVGDGLSLSIKTKEIEC